MGKEKGCVGWAMVWGGVLIVCRIEDINKSCLDQFRAHWECLDDNNQQLWQCRNKERRLNKCVFENLVSLHRAVKPGVLTLHKLFG